MKVNPILLWIAGTVAACTTIATAWVQIGGPVPASQLYVTQSDEAVEKKLTRGLRKVEAEGKKHSEESAKWGRKIYSEELNKLLRLPPPQDPEQHQYWKDNVERSQKWKKFYSDKEIELRKK